MTSSSDTRRNSASPRERVVEAAADLLREGGVDAVTLRAVAGAAGTQPPTIYRLFGDKSGLLDAVAEHEAARYVEEKNAEAESGDPVADLRRAWERNVGFGLANPFLFVHLTDPAWVARSPVAAEGVALLRAGVRRIAAVGRLRVAEDRAVSLIQAAGVGAVLEQLSTPPAERDPEAPEALLDAVMREILTDAPRPDEKPVVTAASSLRASLADLDELTPGERALLDELLTRVIDRRADALPG